MPFAGSWRTSCSSIAAAARSSTIAAARSCSFFSV